MQPRVSWPVSSPIIVTEDQGLLLNVGGVSSLYEVARRCRTHSVSWKGTAEIRMRGRIEIIMAAVEFSMVFLGDLQVLRGIPQNAVEYPRLSTGFSWHMGGEAHLPLFFEDELR